MTVVVPSQIGETRWGLRARTAWAAGGLVALSLLLSLWENRWGAPAQWHPDEIVLHAARMAETRDFNPHFFAYGGLHYSVLIGTAWIPVKLYERALDPMPAWRTPAHERWRDRHVTRLLIAGRAVSAGLTALLVLITLAWGRLLFGRAAGELGALFLCVAPGMVANGHFATVDAAANFWYWIACLGGLLIWRRDGRVWYALAGAGAGLAAGVKIDRLIVVVPLLAAHLLKGRDRRRSDLGIAALSLLLAFVVANPALLLAPFEFLEGFTRELVFNSLRERAGVPYRDLVNALREGLGRALFVAMVPGLWGVLLRMRRVGQRKEVVWLSAAILPYGLVTGFMFFAPRYATLLFPGLLLLVSAGWLALCEAAAARLRPAIGVLIGVVVAVSLATCVALNLQFAHDPRYVAAGWIEANVAPGSAIAVFTRPPHIDERKYRVFRSLTGEREWREGELTTGERVDRSGIYRRVTRLIDGMERWTGRYVGWPPPRTRAYMAWFDNTPGQVRSSEKPPGDLLRADVVVLCEERRPVLDWLRSAGSGFRLARDIHAPDFLGQASSFNFVDPPVYVFQRRGDGSAGDVAQARSVRARSQ